MANRVQPRVGNRRRVWPPSTRWTRHRIPGHIVGSSTRRTRARATLNRHPSPNPRPDPVIVPRYWPQRRGQPPPIPFCDCSARRSRAPSRGVVLPLSSPDDEPDHERRLQRIGPGRIEACLSAIRGRARGRAVIRARTPSVQDVSRAVVVLKEGCGVRARCGAAKSRPRRLGRPRVPPRIASNSPGTAADRDPARILRLALRPLAREVAEIEETLPSFSSPTRRIRIAVAGIARADRGFAFA